MPAFLAAGARLLALFAVVFYGADAVAALHAERWRLYFDWELAIPYWPAAFPVYFSVLALPFVMLPLARRAADLRLWERRMAVTIVLAGVVFVTMPAQLGYAPQQPAGAWRLWALAAEHVAGRYNLLPSLHVALALVTLASAWPLAGPAARAGLALWCALLLPSVLLTHQHHVADLLAGVALAAAVVRMSLLRVGPEA